MDNQILSNPAGDAEKGTLAESFSEEALLLIQQAFSDLPNLQLWDYHAHILGLGTQNTGCRINPNLQSWLDPSEQQKFNLYLKASGINDPEKADQQYLSHLLAMIRHAGKYWPGHTEPATAGKVCILALDKCYDRNGHYREEDTKFYVPNDYVLQLSQVYPDIFVPCVSIHPYRPDALDELDRWGSQGVKMLKWIPGEMGMDASDPLCDAFYEKMKSYGMVLLTHAGKEDAAQLTTFKSLNNPLLLRRPLDHGLKVIIAHCASLGSSTDLDQRSTRLVKNFDLFMRLMEEEKYQDLLFGDISALNQTKRCGKPLLTILQRKDLHLRLVNGSDYPLPALYPLISIDLLSRLGYIQEEERRPLFEIHRKNPVLFDFVLKRTLRDPDDGENGLTPGIFVQNPALGIMQPQDTADQERSRV